MLLLIMLIFALISFTLGAFGVEAKVNWDQLGKAFLVGAIIVSQGLI